MGFNAHVRRNLISQPYMDEVLRPVVLPFLCQHQCKCQAYDDNTRTHLAKISKSSFIRTMLGVFTGQCTHQPVQYSTSPNLRLTGDILAASLTLSSIQRNNNQVLTAMWFASKEGILCRHFFFAKNDFDPKAT